MLQSIVEYKQRLAAILIEMLKYIIVGFNVRTLNPKHFTLHNDQR